MRKKSKPKTRWIMVTGISGAGKTTALKILEDQGFFTIDNPPMALTPSMVQLMKKSKTPLPPIVLGMDAREKNFLDRYPQVLQTFRDAGIVPEILFFEADEKVLVRRFSESRRPHPLKVRGGLLPAIREEKRRLEPLRRLATKIFDTTPLNVHSLKRALQHYLKPGKKGLPFTVSLVSFGYKWGLPLDADMVLDARFLNNPYFVPRLKTLDGTSPSVQQFVLNQKEAKAFLLKLMDLLKFLMPRFQHEGKTHLTVAIGCTGGRHRSVALAERLEKKLKELGIGLTLNHRDMEKEETR